MNVLNSLGVGSGVDTTAVIDALVNAQNTPRDAALTARSTKVEASISALAQLRSGVDGLFTGLSARTAGGVLGAQPASSDVSVVTATATAGPTPALATTTVEVLQLARAQTLVSPPLADADAAIGLGTLTLTVKGVAVRVVVDASRNTLAGLRDAVNAAAGGVTASIVSDAGGARLVFKGDTGSAAAFTIDAAPASGDTGLSRFAYPGQGGAMTAATTAADAQLLLDGVAVSRPTNAIADLVPGVALVLKKVAPGAPVTVAPSRNPIQLAATVGDLVATMSALSGLVASLTKAGDGTTQAAALVGDGATRRLAQALGALTSAPVLPSVAPGIPNRLADLGIVTARDGSFSVDNARLSAVAAKYPDAIEAMLTSLTKAGGPIAVLRSTFDATVGQGGVTATLANARTSIAANRAALATRTADFRATLVKQFAAMEAAVAASKATGAFLDQQIKAWNQTTR